MKKEYKYDVAFSFLSADEQIARNLNEILKRRLNTFIYFDKQDELIGEDAQIKFTNIFGKECRIAVIIYREGWGTSGWTLIEQNSIQTRLFKDGLDFIFVVSLDKKHPIWYPEQYIWDNIEKYGIEATAAIIENKAKKQGSKIVEDTAKSRAEKLNKKFEFLEFRKSYRFSEKGVNDANTEVLKLFALLEQKTIEIKEGNKNLALNFERIKHHRYEAEIIGHGFILQLFWYTRAINNLDDNILTCRIIKGWALGGDRSKPIVVQINEFAFDINENKNLIWVIGNEQLSTNVIADRILKDLIEHISRNTRNA